MRIFYKTPNEIEKMYAAGQLVGEILEILVQHCVPGATTWDLNRLAEAELKKREGKSAFLGYAYPPYPAVLCTSVNEGVVHGIPRKDKVLREGDVVGLDFGAFRHGFCGDSARTVMVGQVSAAARMLVQTTEEALTAGIAQCCEGNRLQDIGWAVQSLVESRGFSVVRQFVGHGIGRAMHEAPMVPNIGKPNQGLRLQPGLVLAIEPMVNAGGPDVVVLDDEWTVVTKDGSLSAHFEHTVAITQRGPWVLTQVGSVIP